jgi:hypothetical protein
LVKNGNCGCLEWIEERREKEKERKKERKK